MPVGKGFTLIEMLVVMLIMIVITTVLLVRQSRYDSSTVLRSLAYGVALSVRQAQVYGTSVVGTSTSAVACGSGFYNALTSSCYAAGYGIYFDATTPTSYILFADLNGDGKYTTNEFVKSFSFSKGYAISDICATESSSGIVDCAFGGPAPGLLTSSAWITAVFKRPNPDACFASNAQPNACAAGGSPFYKSAYVKIIASADSTNTKSITVTVPGEVSVCVTGTSC